MRIISDFCNVVLDSDEFFRSREQDGLGWAIVYFTILSCLALLINIALLANGTLPGGVLLFENILSIPQMQLLLVTYFLLGFPFHLLYAGVLYIALRRSTPFRQVYKATVYGSTPSSLTLWIPVIGLILLIWSLYISVMGLNVYNKKGVRKNLWIALGAGLIVSATVTGTVMFFSMIMANRPDFWTVLLSGLNMKLV